VLRQIESGGRQISHSVQLTVRGKITRYFNGSIQYVYAHAMNDTGGIGWFPPDNYDLSLEWGRANFDQRHRLELMGAVKPGPWFTLGVGLSLRSGRPYNLTTGTDDYSTGTLNARPTGVSRNSLEGPGFAQLDLRWSHEFPLVKGGDEDGAKLTVGVDGFNVLNRVNYAGYSGNLRSLLFGRATSAQPPRRMQLSLTFEM
jgi:hypothetical protein